MIPEQENTCPEYKESESGCSYVVAFYDLHRESAENIPLVFWEYLLYTICTFCVIVLIVSNGRNQMYWGGLL